jgi:hypothetical protein
MITTNDLTHETRYFGADRNGVLTMIGYCDVKHGANLVAHLTLTERPVEGLRLQGMTAGDIQLLAGNEANVFLSSEECNCKINDYIFAYNLGLYGQ